MLSVPESYVVAQGIILSVGAAALGSLLHASSGFLLFDPNVSLTRTLLITAIGVSVHLLVYYAVFRPRLPSALATKGERVRLQMGLLARLLQGGIVEEVQFRWGLMSLIAALGKVLVPAQPRAAELLAIGLSATLFALFHLAGARQIDLARGTTQKLLILVDNAWGGIIFGWLFSKYGLAAAMVSHACFHVAWHPIERYLHRDRPGRTGVSGLQPPEGRI